MADPEGSLGEGGGNQIGAKRRFGEGAGVDTSPAGGGPGTSPEHFWKLDANGAFWAIFGVQNLCWFLLQNCV